MRVSLSKGSNILISLIDSISAPIHIIGDGPDLSRIKHHCAIHSYNHVTIWGKQPQSLCFDILSSVICSIVPSQCGEAFPLSAVESMSCATPVVCSNVGGLGPLIDISCGGIKVNYQLHPEFIAAVQSLLFNPDHAADMGLQGRNYVLNNLSNLGIKQFFLFIIMWLIIKSLMLISFSGVDGAGKSTQISLIANLLSNNNIPFTYLWARGGYTPGFETLKRFVLLSSPPPSSWYFQ